MKIFHKILRTNLTEVEHLPESEVRELSNSSVFLSFAKTSNLLESKAEFLTSRQSANISYFDPSGYGVNKENIAPNSQLFSNKNSSAFEENNTLKHSLRSEEHKRKNLDSHCRSSDLA